MSRARHDEKPRAKGGGIGAVGPVKTEVYAGAGSKVVEEANRRARGGKVHKGKMPHMVHGSMPAHHGNRPGRKSGGSVGADAHPMTSAAHLSAPEGLSRNTGTDSKDD